MEAMPKNASRWLTAMRDGDKEGHDFKAVLKHTIARRFRNYTKFQIGDDLLNRVRVVS